MTAIRTYQKNAFETTLTAEMGATDLIAQVASIGGLTSPCYLVIEPDDPVQREVILFDDTFGASSFVTTSTGNRYLDGSGSGSPNITHPINSIVRSTPVAQNIQDLHDRIDGFTHQSLTGRDADDAHTQYSLVDGSRAFTGEVVGVTPTADNHLATKGYVDVAAAAGVPVGSVLPFAGSAAPSGFLLCWGLEVSRATYADLFAVIGETYGVGDGSTTFNLPDLRGRFPLGKQNTGQYDDLGQTGGELGAEIDLTHSHIANVHTHDIEHGHSHSLAVASAGAHTHSLPAHSHTIPDHRHGYSLDHDHTAMTSATAGVGSQVGSDDTAGLITKNQAGSTTRPYLHTHLVDLPVADYATQYTLYSTGQSTGSVGGTASSSGAHTHSLTGIITPASTDSGAASDAGMSEELGLTGIPDPAFLILNYIIKT